MFCFVTYRSTHAIPRRPYPYASSLAACTQRMACTMALPFPPGVFYFHVYFICYFLICKFSCFVLFY